MSRVALRYAKAILQYANESNATEKVFGDMQDVHATLAGSKELRNLLKSPIVKGVDKHQALVKIFSSTSEITKELINVLVENKRTEMLGGVAASFIHLYNESKGVKVAQVTTAIPLTEKLEKHILTKIKDLTGSDSVSIENTVDGSIIGGFVLRIGDLQYDASIANQFGIIKREFSKSL